MSRIWILTNFVLLGIVLKIQSTTGARSNSTKAIFNTTAARLQVSKGIYLEICDKTLLPKDPTRYGKCNATANTTLIKDGTTTVEGDETCQPGQECHLIIKFQNPEVTLDLTVKYNQSHIKGYWEWTSLKIDGTIGGLSISPDGNGDMNVTPRPGYTTKNKNDINCQRDNTICAPVGLSWTCDDEKFQSKGNLNKNVVIINFPGLQLQPFFARNGSTQALRFGANWDCDPLLSVPLWTGLLVGLGLLMAFYWAVGMISSVNTPDKFDDPKGKQISVPTAD